MSGYIEGVSQTLSGVYTLIQTRGVQAARGDRGVVAYPFTSDWGPANELTNLSMQTEFEKLYHTANETLTAAKVHANAWNGKPQTVQAYRMVSPAGAKGTATLQDGESATALELETLYPSARPFVAVVKAGLLPGTTTVQIVEDSVVLVNVTGTTLEELVEQLNASDYVRVKQQGTAVPGATAGVSFTGGNNGDAVTVTQYQAFLDVLEADGTANAFALDGITDEALLATAEAWVSRVRQEGLTITLVRGGGSSWDTDGGTAANVKSKALNSRGIVNVGGGLDGRTSAELAIYVAARVASVPLDQTLTDEPVMGYSTVNKKLTQAQRVAAKNAGTLMFVSVGGVVQIDEGVNTLTVPHDTTESVEMGKIRVSNTVDKIIKDLEAFGNAYKRTRSNTQEARETFAATVEDVYFRQWAERQLIRPEYSYRPDPEYHGNNPLYTAKIDEAFFTWEVWPVDSMEKIYQKGTVNF